MSRRTDTGLRELEQLVDQVREDAQRRGAVQASQTFKTLDGEITVDWRDGDFLRIGFTGAGGERTHPLHPDWPNA